MSDKCQHLFCYHDIETIEYELLKVAKTSEIVPYTNSTFKILPCSREPIEKKMFQFISGFIFKEFSVDLKNKWGDNEVRFILDQHSYFDFISASPLKQQYTDRYVGALNRIDYNK
jgi:hypothetical protein